MKYVPVCVCVCVYIYILENISLFKNLWKFCECHFKCIDIKIQFGIQYQNCVSCSVQENIVL